MNRWLSVPGQPNSITYAATNEPLISDEVDDRPRRGGASARRRPARARAARRAGGPAVDVGEEARELDEQHEGDEDADDRVARKLSSTL